MMEIYLFVPLVMALCIFGYALAWCIVKIKAIDTQAIGVHILMLLLLAVVLAGLMAGGMLGIGELINAYRIGGAS